VIVVPVWKRKLGIRFRTETRIMVGGPALLDRLGDRRSRKAGETGQAQGSVTA
jgi:hypothetical protein